MMRRSTPERDIGRRRAEEDEEGFTTSLLKKTPSKKTGTSHRWNQYTFRSVMATAQALQFTDPVGNSLCGFAGLLHGPIRGVIFGHVA